MNLPARIGKYAMLAAAVSLVAATARADDHLDDFAVLPGYSVTVWAKTPQLFNPTNIDIDARGRVWVTEAVNYRETVHPLHALKHPNGDRVMVLEDKSGDGVCDSSKVFVQEKDLTAPLGIAVLGDDVVVSCSPNVFVYHNVDDKPEKKEVLLTGFGGFDHDHGVHSVTGFLDGRWYFNVGDMGPQEVRDKSGWWLHSGSCYNYNGSHNTPGRVSDDGRIWTGGLALRVDPDGKHLTPLAFNFRNSFEIGLDSFGNIWQTDNDDDGNQSCRTSWVMEGGNYGFFCADGTRMWGADRQPGQSTQSAHWHQDDPGVIPAQDVTGAGAPTGIVAYEGGLLPTKDIGSILDANAGRSLIWIHHPIPDGAGYRFEKEALIQIKPNVTDEHAHWFRPSDVAIGTDGAIYVADWFDPVVGGHDMKDKKGMGRILRIAPTGDHTRPPKIDLKSLDGQLAALNSFAVNVRYAAAMKLISRRDAAIAPLTDIAHGQDAIKKARALWVLSQLGPNGAAVVESALDDPNPDIRIAAFRALRAVNDRVLENAAVLAGDSSPAVRREVAIAMRDVPFEKCKDILLKLADGFDGRDRFYVEALGIGCDRKESAIYPLLLARIGDADAVKWSDSMAMIAWRLHPVEAIDALAARAAAPSLPESAQRQAVEGLAFIKDDRAASAMIKLASKGPEDVRALAGWWVEHRSTNDWENMAACKEFADAAKAARAKAAAQIAADEKMMLDSNAAKSDRESAIDRLAADHDGATRLVELESDKKLPPELVDFTGDAIYAKSDAGVRAMASQYFPRKNASGVALPTIPQLAAMKGDAERGRLVFFGKVAACANCHRFDGQGKDVGPDLTTIRSKYARPQLLDNILNPSASIAFGYEPWMIKTKDGQVYVGFILADGRQVTLKESTGQQRVIPKRDIVMRKKQPFSIMPDNVALGLKAQDLADLAEFLLNEPVKQK